MSNLFFSIKFSEFIACRVKKEKNEQCWNHFLKINSLIKLPGFLNSDLAPTIYSILVYCLIVVCIKTVISALTHANDAVKYLLFIISRTEPFKVHHFSFVLKA